MLQRSVITIDSPNDDHVARLATRNCHENLTTVKNNQRYPGRNARGRSIIITYGDGPVFDRIPPKDFASGDQTIYILGHGSAERGTLSDLTPGELAAALRDWFGDVPFRGKIKLVSCTTARADDYDAANQPTQAFAGTAMAGIPFVNVMATALKVKLTGTVFRPQSVDGVVGICWVDEQTGEILSLDLWQYLNMSSNPFTIPGAKQRRAAIRNVFPGDKLISGKDAKARAAVFPGR
jgi:hypothetical protein